MFNNNSIKIEKDFKYNEFLKEYHLKGFQKILDLLFKNGINYQSLNFLGCYQGSDYNNGFDMLEFKVEKENFSENLKALIDDYNFTIKSKNEKIKSLCFVYNSRLKEIFLTIEIEFNNGEYSYFFSENEKGYLLKGKDLFNKKKFITILSN
jgi:Fe-S oxidoreductase